MNRTPLDDMARDLVGDGNKPNLYFVSDANGVLLVTTDKYLAYDRWRSRIGALGTPREEATLEDRLVGVLASAEPRDENDPRLVVIDDFERLTAARSDR